MIVVSSALTPVLQLVFGALQLYDFVACACGAKFGGRRLWRNGLSRRQSRAVKVCHDAREQCSPPDQDCVKLKRGRFTEFRCKGSRASAAVGHVRETLTLRPPQQARRTGETPKTLRPYHSAEQEREQQDRATTRGPKDHQQDQPENKPTKGPPKTLRPLKRQPTGGSPATQQQAGAPPARLRSGPAEKRTPVSLPPPQTPAPRSPTPSC